MHELGIIKRYEEAHAQMLKTGQPIHPELLRRYLDVIRRLRRQEVGQFHSKVVILPDRIPYGDYGKMVKQVFVTGSETGSEFRVSGQHWSQSL